MSQNHYRKTKEEYIKIAKELVYPIDVIRKLEKAKTESECIRILHTTRENLR